MIHPTPYPWSASADHDRDGTWADFAAWESWVRERLPDYSQDEWDEVDAWELKVDLYVVMTKLWDEAKGETR